MLCKMICCRSQNVNVVVVVVAVVAIKINLSLLARDHPHHVIYRLSLYCLYCIYSQ